MKIRKVGKLNYYDDLAQGTQEWLEVRAGLVTCSNALTLMNKGKEQCKEANQLSLGRLKTNGNWYAERGHVIENEFRDAYNKKLHEMGMKIVECGFITNDDYPDVGYSPDGLIVKEGAEEDILGLIEFKAYNDLVIRSFGRAVSTPTGGAGEEIVLRAKHRKACLDILDVPPNCIAQCNMAMLITGAPQVELLLCNPDAAKTDEFIAKLKNSDASSDQKMLREAIPNGDYDTPTPITGHWTIRRNEKIIARILKKLRD